MNLPPFLQRIWNDPVWSKVIAGVILFGLATSATLIITALTNNWLLSVVAVLFVLAWAFCWWVYLGRATIVLQPTHAGPSHRYRRSLRKWALLGICGIPIVLISGYAVWWYSSTRPSRKIVVAVADFEGPQPQSYRVTELLLLKLRQAAKKYPDLQIHALRQTITEQEGSVIARSKGAQIKASLVLWGYYATEDAPFLLVHLEKLSGPSELTLTADEEKLDVPLGEPPSVTLRQKFPSEMAYLVLYTVGLARYEANDYDGAISGFSDALARGSSPNQLLSPADAYFFRGNSYAFKGRPDMAVADYSQSINAEPTSSAYYNRGFVNAKQGRLRNAIQDFDQVITLRPDDADAYGFRGLTHWLNGDIDAAISDCGAAIALGSHEQWIAYSVRGGAYGLKHRFNEAIADLGKATALKPADAGILRKRGSVYVLMGKYQLASMEFERSIALQPENATFYLELGGVYMVKVLKESSPATHSRNAGFLVNKKDTEAALANLDKAIALRPAYAEAYDKRGFMYAFLGQNERAIADYRKVLEVSSSPTLRWEAHQMLSKLGAN